MHLNLNAIPNIFCTAFLLAIGCFVYYKKCDKTSFAFLLLTITTAVWQAGVALTLSSNDPNTAFMWSTLTYVGPIFIPVALLHFIANLLGKSDLVKKIKYIYLFVAVLFIPMLKLNFLLKGVNHYSWGFWYKPTIFHPFFILYYYVLFFVSIFILFSAFKSATAQRKQQIKYLLLSFLIASGGGIDFVADFGFNVYPIGFLFVIICLSIIAYAILQHHLMDINIIIRRGLLYSAIVALVTGLYVAFLTFTNQFILRGNWEFKSSFLNAFALPFVFYQWTILLTAILSLFLALFVYAKNRTKVGTWFSIFAILVAFWAFFYFLSSYVKDYETARFLLRTCMIAGALILPVFTEFVHVFVGKKTPPLIKYGNVLLCLIIILPIYTDLYGIDSGPLVGFRYVPIIGPIGLVEVMQYFINVFIAEMVLISSLKGKDLHLNNQIKFLIFATILGFFGASTNFLLWFQIPFPPIFNILIPIYIFIVAYAILKHQLMDIEIVLRKGLLYSLLVGLLTSLYLSGVFLFGNYLGGRKSAASILFTIFSIVFFSIIFQPLRDKIQEFIDKVFFRGKYDYQKTLKELSLVARSIAGLDELLDKVLTAIVGVIKLNNASIYVLDKRGGQYFVRRSIGIDIKRSLPENDDIIKQLASRKEAIMYDETSKTSGNISGFMKEISTAIIFPIISKDELVGFLCLGEKLSGEVYSDEDIDLLTTLCNQMGVSIENAMLYEDALEAQKKLYQADKLATVGALAAGLAHEIKNPIAAIKGFSQVIDKAVAEKDTEAIRDFRDVVPRQLDRINDIVEKLLTLSKPPKLEKKKIDINALLVDIVKLIEKQALKQRVEIVKSFEDLPQTLADPEQLTQAFLNLILNAIQSMPDGGQIEIRTKFMGTDRIIVEFIDNGIGIPKEKLARIFDPFYTTKTGGSGLGLSVTQKIIIDHHGKIDVESVEGKGTAFKIILPVVD